MTFKHIAITEYELDRLTSDRWSRHISQHLDCDLRLRNGRFELRSIRTGVHSLDASVTDLARLNAHWEGFCRNVFNMKAED